MRSEPYTSKFDRMMASPVYGGNNSQLSLIERWLLNHVKRTKDLKFSTLVATQGCGQNHRHLSLID
jgi:hypothetical protein